MSARARPPFECRFADHGDTWSEVDAFDDEDAARSFANQSWADCDYASELDVLVRRRGETVRPRRFSVRVEMEPVFYVDQGDNDEIDIEGDAPDPEDADDARNYF